MKSGTRALGIAFSDGNTESTCAGAVVRADRVVDGFGFSSCSVGGLDATDAIVSLVADLDRPDVQYLLLAGVAPAWFNLIDLSHVHAETGLATLAVSFEDSEGLGDAIREQFSGEDREYRLAVYDSLPPRQPVIVGDDTVFVRAVGLDDAAAAEVVRAYTPEGGRPEPLRVARLVARAGRGYREAPPGRDDAERRR